MKKLSFKKLFKSEVSIFALFTGLKVAGIFVGVLLLVSYIFWIILSLNNVFFESQGFVTASALREAYFDYVLKSVSDLAPYILAFVIALFFAGVFVANILLRPFQIIARYCEKKAQGEEAIYDPDSFSDFKLLTRFSSIFFLYLDEVKEKGKLEPASIPSQFLGIHKPVFDKVFFFHFFFLILIIALISVSMLNMGAASMRQDMVDLAVSSLKMHGAGTSHFFQEQAYLYDSISVVAALLLVAAYILLSFHLYGRVSGAIFGFFSTMRSFMKGDSKARVRLLGYNHVRPYGRAFNQYLKYIDIELGKKEKSGNK